MAYQLYRNTTLGNSLQESLDELIQSQQITPQLALQVLLQFDKAINSALAQRVRNRVNFRVRMSSCIWKSVLLTLRAYVDLTHHSKIWLVWFGNLFYNRCAKFIHSMCFRIAFRF
ncbi:mCG2938, isoform CRA_b [Mus musculus]|uniref:Transcription initiation factor IIA gamma chain n=1 Tax=Mus musculus TaxID=10090 RepID=Q3UT44_MOUSE|nr:Gtf2a2 protein [Mus musculus]EDL26181.1 mCG2938, isoform CRA_b [Mus musculus]BAE24136.1 unnamed protein product [Mus musculus]